MTNNLEQEEIAERENAEVNVLMEHWKQTLELRNDQATTFDKSILWASGGALALTVVNVDKIAGPTGVSCLLIACWLVFALSIFLNISSYWTSMMDAEAELKKIRKRIEDGMNYKHGNWFRRATYILNFSALFLFLIGVILLLMHCYYHLMEKTP